MKPTHRLKYLNKKTEERGELGAGWLNKDGSITVQLNPFVQMQQSPEIVFTLFPEFPRKAKMVNHAKRTRNDAGV